MTGYHTTCHRETRPPSWDSTCGVDKECKEKCFLVPSDGYLLTKQERKEGCTLIGQPLTPITSFPTWKPRKPGFAALLLHVLAV